jgi:hypothetical protein
MRCGGCKLVPGGVDMGDNGNCRELRVFLCVSIGLVHQQGENGLSRETRIMRDCIPTRTISFCNILCFHLFRKDKRRPMGLCESAKGRKVLESDLPEVHSFHTLAQTTVIGCHNTFLHHCRVCRILCCSNSLA